MRTLPRPLAVAFLASACCHCPEPPQIPQDWRACAVAPPFPPVPPPPRTVSLIVAWANANAAALGKTQAALADCRTKLVSVVRLVREEP